MVVIEKLGPISVLLAVALSFCGVTVRFFDMSSLFKKRRVLWVLEKLGVVWLSYYDFPDEVQFEEEERLITIFFIFIIIFFYNY